MVRTKVALTLLMMKHIDEQPFQGRKLTLAPLSLAAELSLTAQNTIDSLLMFVSMSSATLQNRLRNYNRAPSASLVNDGAYPSSMAPAD